MRVWPVAADEVLANREEAGRLLAQRLRPYCNDPNALVLAVPRGGVPVGYEMSLALGLPLDVFISRKLGAPGYPEYAVGAVAETGSVFFNQEALTLLSLTPRQLDADVQHQRDEIARRQLLYREGRVLPKLSDRTVLLVDDGVATGATFFVSVQALKQAGVKRLVAALPVGPVDTLTRLAFAVEELVVLVSADPFFAVGNHYMDFAQVKDTDVIRYLKAAAALYQRQHPTDTGS